MKKNNNKIKGILKFAKEKNKATLLQVENTLKQMLEQQQTITFSQVAKQAQVSRSWLYKNEKIKNKIEAIRKRQNKKQQPNIIIKAEGTQKMEIASLKKRIQKLEQENKKLRSQLEIAYGKMVE